MKKIIALIIALAVISIFVFLLFFRAPTPYILPPDPPQKEKKIDQQPYTAPKTVDWGDDPKNTMIEPQEVSTPEWQIKYFRTEGRKENPLSPAEWLKSQN